MLLGWHLVLVVAVTQDKPPTIPDLLKKMHATYRSLKGFNDEWEVKGPNERVQFTRLIDGNRYRILVRNGSERIIDEAFDGKAHLAMLHSEKTYWRAKGNPFLGAPYKLQGPGGDGTHNFRWGITAYDFWVWMEPWPVFKRQETIRVDGISMRHLEFEGVLEDRSKVKFAFWFDEKDWLVHRFEMTGEDGLGNELAFSAKCKFSRGNRFKDREFVISPDLYKGYAIKELPKGGD